jgi:hypothetical protein
MDSVLNGLSVQWTHSVIQKPYIMDQPGTPGRLYKFRDTPREVIKKQRLS